MAVNVETLRAGGPDHPARPLAPSRARQARRLRLDFWASRLVVVVGLVVIGSILAILVVIVSEVFPLFREPRADPLPVRAFAGIEPLPGGAFGVDEYREIAFVTAADGQVALLALDGKRPVSALAVAQLDGARLTAVAALGPSRYLLATSDGRAIPFRVSFGVEFADGRRIVTARPEFGPPMRLDSARRPVLRLAGATPEGGPVAVAQLGPRELALHTVIERKPLIGPARREEAVQRLSLAVDGQITALAMDGRGDDLFVGTSRGQLVRYDLRDRTRPVRADTTQAASAPVTALGFLIGDRTLVVGDAAGGVSTWQVIRPDDAASLRLTRIHEFERHGERVIAITSSARDKGFATADAGGTIHLSHGTTGRTLLKLATPASPIAGLAIAPKADAVLAVSGRGQVAAWALDNPHPEVTLGTLFGPVWYEGYSRPDYVWQSTGGTDDFEPKFSLTPLLYGTLKGTFYALLIAAPLALLAALYVSEFMHPTLKGYLKPVVEIMAALPSVVLGFLAGLWLAPMVERVVPGLFLLPLVLVAAILVALGAWRLAPVRLRRTVRPGGELVLLVPVVLLSGLVAFGLGMLLERLLLAGDYRHWLLSTLGLTYDQRNSLVVGIAMGFAVIPIIFTIAEDSLANVPQHLRAGSLALGATHWQTAVRVVLPTASPGIFSAIMIGFGRAVGETMIVLMATGNTPVMDWSIFSGFRALSANIAVELPEAPEGGTLFRVLFLAALLLFGLTFVVNTAAELVRLRLRRKYRYL